MVFSISACLVFVASSERKIGLLPSMAQGVVIPIGAIVTAATGVKKRSRGQGLFWVSVKRSRTIFKLGNSGQDINVLRVRIAHSIVKCVRSNGQGPICGAVKRSSNKNNGQKFCCDYSTYRSDHPLWQYIKT